MLIFIAVINNLTKEMQFFVHLAYAFFCVALFGCNVVALFILLNSACSIDIWPATIFFCKRVLINLFAYLLSINVCFTTNYTDLQLTLLWFC